MTYPHERIAADPHDRIAEARRDDDALQARWEHPDSRVLVVAGTRVRLRDDGVEWIAAAEAPAGVRVLLGERDGATWWAVIVDPAEAAGEPDEWRPLRSALGRWEVDLTREGPLVLHAIGLAEWHWTTRFCPRCGAALADRAAGHEKVCTACGRPQFPRSDPAVIMLVTHGAPGSAQERCLLGHQPTWPPQRYSTLAGFCEPGERLEDAVRREVLEETGVRVGRVDYFGSQGWPFPASLMVGYFGRAETTDIRVDAQEIEDARWFTREELRSGAEDGSLLLPSGVSISRSLVEHWYGEPLSGTW